MRVLGKVPPERRQAALESVQDEIHGERARALSRTIHALEEALSDLERPPSRRRPPARSELVAEAAERLWFAVIQREALGLAHHDEFLRELRVPGEVVRAMGPRRRGA